MSDSAEEDVCMHLKQFLLDSGHVLDQLKYGPTLVM
jgi:hypothetical protein